jgi:putative oxidoreductase
MSVMNGPSWADDFGKLFLRLAVGGLLLFHGIQKIQHDAVDIMKFLEVKGLRGALVLGSSHIGEVVAPVLILAGILSRLGSVAVMGTIVLALYVPPLNQMYFPNPYGGWAMERYAFFFLGALALALMGPGRLSLLRSQRWYLQ